MSFKLANRLAHAFALVVCCCGAVATENPVLNARDLARLKQTLSSLDAPGATIALSQDGETVDYGLGWADKQESHAMPADARTRLGSVTKLYLAGVVLQLVDEGTLNLDDPIAQYVSGVPNGEAITLRMLGRHTSGLDDAIRQMPFHGQIVADPSRTWPVDELLAAAFAPGPRHAPGTAWAYSNTNSILLSLAVEKATDKTWREHVHQRFLEPLGLDDTGFNETPSVSGYRYGKNEDLVGYGGHDNHVWFDATDWSASWTGAAGEMTGTAADTARYVQALFGGELLSEASLNELTSLADTGEGTFFYGFHCHAIGREQGVVVVGHGGDVPGFSSSAAWLPESQTAVVVLANLSAELDKWSSAGKLMDTVLTIVTESGRTLEDGTSSVLDPAVEPSLDGLVDAELKSKLQEAFDASSIRAAQVALVDSRGQVSQARLGEFEKRFRAGSVSKLLTSLLVLRAAEAGVVRLDDPVVKWLPGVFGDSEGAEDVTLEQLLEHTGGVAGSGPSEYAADEPGLLPRDYVAARYPFRLRWRPGLHYSYSNPGYTIAAAAVEEAWNDDFDTLMQREVLTPLGMQDTTFDAESPPSYQRDGVTRAEIWNMPVRPAGSAVTTAADLAKVAAMLLADGGDFLTPSSVNRLERGETGILAEVGGGEGAYGLGTFAYIHENHTFRAHWGKTEGFRATLAYLANQRDRSAPSSGEAAMDAMSKDVAYILLVDTADDRGVWGLRSILNDWVTSADKPVTHPQTANGSIPSEFEGWYVNASHDVPERTWLMGLLTTRRLASTADGVEVTPLLSALGASMTWQRVDKNLYRADQLPVASGATWSEAGDRFWIDGESFRQRPAWVVLGQITILAAGVTSALIVVGSWPLIVTWRLFKNRRKSTAEKQSNVNSSKLSTFEPSQQSRAQTVPIKIGLYAERIWPHCLALAGLCLLVLLFGFCYFHLTSSLSRAAQLGTVGAIRLTLVTVGLLGPIALLGLLYLAARDRSFRERRIRLAWTLMNALVLLAVFSLLTVFGLIPYWPS